ncbi:hypothetical protein DZC72_17245 [Maribacter algicola]|uniref:LD-carboxypeptidase N-terminal domain-containing protein n=1 Tax=Maribacter algicola TaxID=2498892 RepID=A0A426REN9_9FLAO|nr:LD-carboxypeptidase [Maribacter algicola]RRQ47486.1 hypothetical protein DZC72_17245 [Maribacter algicola]
MNFLFTERLTKSHGYFSHTDVERAADLIHMFQNKNVDGILCIRECHGCTQILILIEYDLIQSNPKPLIGLNDVTALLNSIYKRTGLITLHGSVGGTFDDNFPKKDCIDAIRKPEQEMILQNAKRIKEHR